MKAIIFDFDGTLADSLLLGLEGVNKLAKPYKYQAFEDPEYLRSKGVAQIIKEDLGLKWYQFPFYLRSLKKILLPELPKLKLYPGVPEMLGTLSGRARLFILTSNIEPAVRYILDKYQLDCFEGVYADTSLFKKHKKLKRLLEKHDLKASNTIYVGDEVRDVEACRKVGMPIISVSYGFNNRKKLSEVQPDHIADDPKALMGLLKNHLGTTT